MKKIVARFLMLPVLVLHSYFYKLSGFLAVIINDGIHPKHRIIRYTEWFISNVEHNWTILDVGSNLGVMAKGLSRNVKHVYGIEILPGLVEKAESINAAENIVYICADATVYDYSNIDRIDCVTLSNVLEHIEDRELFLARLIEKINWRCGKRFLIRVPAIDRDWITVYKKELGLDYRLDKTHAIEYTYQQLHDELLSVGMKIDGVTVRYGEFYVVCSA